MPGRSRQGSQRVARNHHCPVAVTPAATTPCGAENSPTIVPNDAGTGADRSWSRLISSTSADDDPLSLPASQIEPRCTVALVTVLSARTLLLSTSVRPELTRVTPQLPTGATATYGEPITWLLKASPAHSSGRARASHSSKGDAVLVRWLVEPDCVGDPLQPVVARRRASATTLGPMSAS